MRARALLPFLVAPLCALSAPSPLTPRQTSRVQFCQKISPAPSEDETKARFDQFADAFIVRKNLDDAFAFIAPEYVNHNPIAKDGAQFAYDLLSPVWPTLKITVIRTMFRGDMGWLNYKSDYGVTVDRYRWEAGCIVEHWDAGEQMPDS